MRSISIPTRKFLDRHQRSNPDARLADALSGILSFAGDVGIEIQASAILFVFSEALFESLCSEA